MSSPPRRHPNVINADELEPWAPPQAGPAGYGATVKRVAAAAGSKELGANIFSLPAGKAAVPVHAHHNNEEAAFVLSGRGSLVIGEARVEVRAGDWIAFPSGDEYAHQLIADQGEPIEYLMISTMNRVDVVTYPRSKKVLAAVGMQVGGPGMRKMFRQEDGNVGYWEGEEEPGA